MSESRAAANDVLASLMEASANINKMMADYGGHAAFLRTMYDMQAYFDSSVARMVADIMPVAEQISAMNQAVDRLMPNPDLINGWLASFPSMEEVARTLSVPLDFVWHDTGEPLQFEKEISDAIEQAPAESDPFTTALGKLFKICVGTVGGAHMVASFTEQDWAVVLMMFVTLAPLTLVLASRPRAKIGGGP